MRALAAAIGEDHGTIEDFCEPFLIQEGFLQRTPRGRVATRRAYEHLGYPDPRRPQPDPLLIRSRAHRPGSVEKRRPHLQTPSPGAGRPVGRVGEPRRRDLHAGPGTTPSRSRRRGPGGGHPHSQRQAAGRGRGRGLRPRAATARYGRRPPVGCWDQATDAGDPSRRQHQRPGPGPGAWLSRSLPPCPHGPEALEARTHGRRAAATGEPFLMMASSGLDSRVLAPPGLAPQEDPRAAPASPF